tara:strand:- start:287 stop:478 length:192 start_codon:yes stop_codon:yes gene_type:complete
MYKQKRRDRMGKLTSRQIANQIIWDRKMNAMKRWYRKNKDMIAVNVGGLILIMFLWALTGFGG